MSMNKSLRILLTEKIDMYELANKCAKLIVLKPLFKCIYIFMCRITWKNIYFIHV